MTLTNEQVKYYDTIVGTVVANILSEAARNDNKIYLKDFDPSLPSHRVYFYGATIGSMALKEKINFSMPLIKYIKFKFSHWKIHEQLKYISPKKVPENITPIQTIVDHMEKFHNIEGDQLIWQSILDAYYEPKGENTDEDNCN